MAYTKIIGDLGVKGNAAQGDIVWDGSTALAKDVFANNITIQAGATINTGGFRLFAKNRITIEGVLTRQGNPAQGLTGGVAVSANTCSGGTAGGNAGTVGNIGSNSTAQAIGMGGKGGNGGAGTFAAGTAGAVTGPNAANGSTLLPNTLAFALWDKTAPHQNPIAAASGGGGGGGGVAQDGGGGGGGAGTIVIGCRTLLGSGTITAKGGSGDNGTGDSGGGGGGGGGMVFISAQKVSSSLTIDVSGGDPGTPGAGTGATGSFGTTGVIIRLA